MKTTLNADGKISIPDELRSSDRLVAGDSFLVERLTPGHYLLAKQQTSAPRLTISTAQDGLPVISTENGVITAQIVKDLESQMP